jgi:hypothetical protein
VNPNLLLWLTVEANGRHDEQFHGGDLIMQEGTPSLAWRVTPLGHVLDETRLRHLKPELEQFAVVALFPLPRSQVAS